MKSVVRNVATIAVWSEVVDERQIVVWSPHISLFFTEYSNQTYFTSYLLLTTWRLALLERPPVMQGTGREGTGRRGKERKGERRKGKEKRRKGKEREGKERKGTIRKSKI
jgi:hypothetical protein